VKNWKIGDLSNFERRQITGVCLAGASVIKTATLLGVSRDTVSEIMSAYTRQRQRRGRAKTTSDRMRSSYIEKDCFEKSQNYCSTNDSRTEYSS
jgi:IS30 family transposase